MPHSIKVLHSQKIVNVIFDGGVNLDERIASVKEVCNLLPSDTPVLLLIDVRALTNLMSNPEQEYFGRFLASKSEFKQAKVAVLSQAQTHNPNTIINNVAYLNGYHLVPFTCRSEAIYWLEGSVV
jgi:hypothetical protein